MPPELTGVLRRLAQSLPASRVPGIANTNHVSFPINSRCPASCTMCSVKGSKGRYPAFSVEEVRAILTQVARLKSPRNDGWLDLWGGEPFADFDLLCGIVQVGNELGFSTISINTNGFWGKDPAEAERMLRELQAAAPSVHLRLTFSVDSFHQSQPILNIGNVANIILLLETKFPGINYSFHSLPTKDAAAARTKLATSIFDRGLSVGFLDSTGYRGTGTSLLIGLTEKSYKPRNFLTLGPCVDPRHPAEICDQLEPPSLFPARIANDQFPLSTVLAIGLNRQVYLQIEYIPIDLLPMGSVDKQSIAEIITGIEDHPIVASWGQRGYCEIYMHLVKIFDFDSWIRRFYAPQFILQGLEHDDPFAAIGEVDTLRPVLNPIDQVTLSGSQPLPVLWGFPDALADRLQGFCRDELTSYGGKTYALPGAHIIGAPGSLHEFLYTYGLRVPTEIEARELVSLAPQPIPRPFAATPMKMSGGLGIFYPDRKAFVTIYDSPIFTEAGFILLKEE